MTSDARADDSRNVAEARPTTSAQAAIAFFAVLRLAPAALFALLLKLLHAGALIVE